LGARPIIRIHLARRLQSPELQSDLFENLVLVLVYIVLPW
jgi:hypothetical protein